MSMQEHREPPRASPSTGSGAELMGNTGTAVDLSCPHVWSVNFRVLMGRCDKAYCGLTGIDVQECMLCGVCRCADHRDG